MWMEQKHRSLQQTEPPDPLAQVMLVAQVILVMLVAQVILVMLVAQVILVMLVAW
jgi:hypothetical protein